MENKCRNCQKELTKHNTRFCKICWCKMCDECYSERIRACNSCMEFIIQNVYDMGVDKNE